MNPVCAFYEYTHEAVMQTGDPRAVTSDGHPTDGSRFLVPLAGTGNAVMVDVCAHHRQILEKVYRDPPPLTVELSGDSSAGVLGQPVTPAQMVYRFMTSPPEQRERAMAAQASMHRMAVCQRGDIERMIETLKCIARMSGALTEVDENGAINLPARMATECLTQIGHGL